MAAMKALRFIACAMAWIAAVVCVAWAFGALYFDFPTARTFTAILFVLVLITAIIFVRGKLLKLAIVFGAFALVALWWLTLKPGNDRAWQPDVAQTAWARLPHRDRFHAPLGNAHSAALADQRYGRGY